MHPCTVLSWVAFGFAAVAAPAIAASSDGDLAGFQLNLDNDVFARPNTDRWYTNGIRASWTYKGSPSNVLSQSLRRGSEWFLWDGVTPTLTYSAGQTMYTPRDITRSDPQAEDRPWGALLFGSVTAHAYSPDARRSEFRATEIKFGITGEGALGEPVQAGIHRLTQSARPQGWDQQLRSRLGIQLSHARVRRLRDLATDKWLGVQWGWGVGAGSLRVHGNLNAALLIGDLSGPDAPLLIGNEGDFVVQDFSNRDQFRNIYVFLAGNVTGVAYNYFLEGPTAYGRSNIEPRRSYAMVTTGFSLPTQRWLGKGWPRIVYAQTTRSPEFSSPTLGRAETRQRWGTLTLNWDRE